MASCGAKSATMPSRDTYGWCRTRQHGTCLLPHPCSTAVGGWSGHKQRSRRSQATIYTLGINCCTSSSKKPYSLLFMPSFIPFFRIASVNPEPQGCFMCYWCSRASGMLQKNSFWRFFVNYKFLIRVSGVTFSLYACFALAHGRISVIASRWKLSGLQMRSKPIAWAGRQRCSISTSCLVRIIWPGVQSRNGHLCVHGGHFALWLPINSYILLCFESICPGDWELQHRQKKKKWRLAE